MKVVLRERYISLLPNLITIFSLCLGLAAIKEAMHGQYRASLCFIFFASIMDGLDGRMARLLNVSSKLGAELDSLCDIINFGVAPAILNYLWCTHKSAIGWIIGSFSIICIVIRIARFNIAPKKPFFIGLSSPMFAGFSLFPLAIVIESSNTFKVNTYWMMIYIVFCSLLAISKIETFSIKNVTSSGKSLLFKALTITIVFLSLFRPVVSIIVICSLYALFMPLAPIKYKEVNISK